MKRWLLSKIPVIAAIVIFIATPITLLFIFKSIENTVYSAEGNLISATLDTLISFIEAQFKNLNQEKEIHTKQVHEKLIKWTNIIDEILQNEKGNTEKGNLIERLATMNDATFIVYNRSLNIFGKRVALPQEILNRIFKRLSHQEYLFMKFNEGDNPALIYAKKFLKGGNIIISIYPLDELENSLRKLEHEVIRTIRETIISLRIEERGYVVVISGKKETFFAHPNPKFDGKPVPLEPERNRNLMKIIRESVTKGEGLFSYLWYGDEENKVVSKLAFVRYYKPLDWYILGTIYEDDLRKIIRKYNFLAATLVGIGSTIALILYLTLTRKLRENVRNLKLTWETAGVGLVTCLNGGWEIVEINNHFEYILGRKRNEIIGKPITNFVHTEDYIPFTEYLEKAHYKSYSDFQARLLKGEGEIVYAIIRSSLIRERNLLLLSVTDITKMIELQRELEKANEILQSLSSRDHLTGAFNRRTFENILKEELERAKSEKEHISLIMLDIDHFKRINDTHGHLVGDYILKSLVKLLGSKLRLEDTIFRYGGEEFFILLLKTDKKKALNIAERLRNEIENYEFNYRGKDKAPFKIRLTCSFGVSTFPEDGDRLEELISKADEALYRAKKEGRNRVKSA